MSLTPNPAAISSSFHPQQRKLVKANIFIGGYQFPTAVAKCSKSDGFCITSFISQEPILKKALQEPVAFMGGIFAGFLRLDLTDDPLKEWVTKTVEAAGITLEELNIQQEEAPQEIVIE